MRTLFIIPARKGSKGIPNKSIKMLAGKPLICHSIDLARKFAADKDICFTTDSEEYIKVAENYGLKVPFTRPDHLATDNAGSYEFLLHALNYYKENNERYERLVLLQPTSPFRQENHVHESMQLFDNTIDMVVSVKKSEANPYYNLFEENEAGFLTKSKPSDITRRQDSPDIWEYNGAVYVININSLLKQPIGKFTKVRKYVMDELHSLDLDTMLDWEFAEFLLLKGLVKMPC